MKLTIRPVTITIPPSIIPRSAGVHVSGIIRAIATETGILKPEWVEELALIEVRPSLRFLDPVVALRISMGLAWEEWYIPNVLGPEGVIDHPGEYLVDGVYMSPDGEELSSVIVQDRHMWMPKVHEVKCTYKSTNTVGDAIELLEQGQWMWMAQIKSYCKAIGALLADLHVLFVCGDYSYPIQPQVKRFSFEFTQEEIRDNWDTLVAYKEHRLQIEGYQ